MRFKVELLNAGCAPIVSGTGASTLVTVLDNDQVDFLVGFLVLSPTSVNVRSDDGNITITISRVQGSSTPVSTNYITLPGTGLAGQVIPLLDLGGGRMPIRTFTFQLTYMVGITLLDGAFQTAVQIADVHANPGVVGFKKEFECRGPVKTPAGNCYYFAEGEAYASLVLQRTGGQLGEVSVVYVVTNVTSDAFGNFGSYTGVVSWGSGDASDKTIQIPLLVDRTSQEIVEFARVTLTNFNPLVDIVDTPNAVAYVGVMDRDAAGFIRVETISSLVAETAGSVQFALVRDGAACGCI
ncbi:hypothetical protein T484DRAFT_1797867 [Baffinella frigidus]|nr:hypothetical protein T484DRAFT_1797867 [Cryptophyta sp. CCMP2293]